MKPAPFIGSSLKGKTGIVAPFDYPAAPHERRHGPWGYTDYASYRPWLRDEFTFRCVYCLKRETWSRGAAGYNIDHFQPQALRADLGAKYENLLYSCGRCNLAKGVRTVPDPLVWLTAQHVSISPDGSLTARSPEAKRLIWLLDLDSPEAREWRLIWMRNVELAGEHDSVHLRRILGFPDDLPELRKLQPPGNHRPNGVNESFHAQREAGELPPTC